MPTLTMGIRLTTYPVRDSYSQLVVVHDDDHWTAADDSPRATLDYDPKIGSLAWNERARSGRTAEWRRAQLTAIFAIVGDDGEARQRVGEVTEQARQVARRRASELLASADGDCRAAGRRLLNDVDSDWLWA